jgi:hypothetical protein
MGPISLADDDLRMILMLLGLLVLGISGATLHARHEWKALRHKLFQSVESPKALSLPSRLAQRLDRERWESTFRETLSRSRRDFQVTGNATAVAAMETVERNAERLAPVVEETALCAMTEGELRSALLRLEELLVYVLVFPGRHDDRRTFRRSESLAHGWPAHSQAVLGAVDQSKSAQMLSFLYFLGVDAVSGTLLVAYDGEGGSFFPQELADPVNGSVHGSGVAGPSQEFVLV